MTTIRPKNKFKKKVCLEFGLRQNTGLDKTVGIPPVHCLIGGQISSRLALAALLKLSALKNYLL